jgi:UDP-glucose:(heptosyl)LPS alpha-1,3-glucosyltransferase
MKIAIIRQKYTPFGGAERYSARLVDALLDSGHEVHIFASRWDIGTSSGVRVHEVQTVTLFGWLRALSFALNCRRLLMKESFDAIFSLERTLYQDFYRAGDGCHRRWLIQKNLGKGMLSRLITFLNPLHWTYLWLEHRLFSDRNLKGIIANSNFVKEDIISMYGVSPEKIRVVYNGVDFPVFDKVTREKYRRSLAEEYGLGEGLRILYVGSGFERKGVPTLIHAAAELTIPFQLFIVGKGNVGKYRQMAENLGIADKTNLTGPVKDMERFYLGCDLFVFPTLYDPFSNATLEAMAYGLPVVTTPFNGVSEIIEEGKQGAVVKDPLSALAVAEAIMRFATSEALEKSGMEARRTASSFTMERNVRESIEAMICMSDARMSGHL